MAAFPQLGLPEHPKRQGAHLICDTYATHKHDKVKAWKKRHPRFHYHFTPTSASWLNVAERTGFRGAEIEIFVDILVNPWND